MRQFIECNDCGFELDTTQEVAELQGWQINQGPFKSRDYCPECWNEFHKGENMHYRNGREAKNGDKLVKLEAGKVVSFGVLHGATPGNDFCNGNIAIIQSPNDYACLCDCLHIDDIAELLKEKGLDKRPN